MNVALLLSKADYSSKRNTLLHLFYLFTYPTVRWRSALDMEAGTMTAV